MTQHPDQGLGQALEAWLREGSDGLRDRDAVLGDLRRRLPSTPQRGLPWWARRPVAVTRSDVHGLQAATRPRSSPSAAIVTAVLAVIVGAFLLGIAQHFGPPAVTLPGQGTEAQRLPPVTGPAGNGLITFARDGDIYLGDPVTGESEAIVAGPEMDTSPRFSPDGTQIAFWRIRLPADDEQHGERDLVIVRADGSDERVIDPPDKPFVAAIGDFIWTPDGQSLVLTRPTGRGGPEMALSMLDVAGVAEARLLEPSGGPYGFDDQVAWFLRPPSGDRVLKTGWAVDPILAVEDVDGSDSLALVERADLEQARRDTASGTTDLRYVGVWSEAWSPDAARIAFVASAGTDPYFEHLFVVDADGSDLRLLSEEAGRGMWSPDGSTIAVQRSNRIEPGSTESCPDEWYIDFCSSAAWIALIDVESGAARDLDASRLPDPDLVDAVLDEPAIGGWSWSPDGQAIVMHGYDGFRPFVIDVATDTATELPWASDSVPSWQRVAVD